MSHVSNLERTMSVKVTPEQMRVIKRAAKSRGMRLSQWMRHLLVQGSSLVLTQNGTSAQLDAPRLP